MSKAIDPHRELQAMIGIFGLLLFAFSGLVGLLIWGAFSFITYWLFRRSQSRQYGEMVGVKGSVVVILGAAFLSLVHNVYIGRLHSDAGGADLDEYLRAYDYVVAPAYTILLSPPYGAAGSVGNGRSAEVVDVLRRFYFSGILMVAASFLFCVTAGRRTFLKLIAEKEFRGGPQKSHALPMLVLAGMNLVLYYVVFFDVPANASMLGVRPYDPSWQKNFTNIYLLLRQLLGPCAFFLMLYFFLLGYAVHVVGPLRRSSRSS